MPTAKHGSGEDDDESIISSFPRVRLGRSDLEDWLMSRATLSIPHVHVIIHIISIDH